LVYTPVRIRFSGTTSGNNRFIIAITTVEALVGKLIEGRGE
jgi:hypothetical protein